MSLSNERVKEILNQAHEEAEIRIIMNKEKRRLKEDIKEAALVVISCTIIFGLLIWSMMTIIRWMG